jgi:hypothetical protein
MVLLYFAVVLYAGVGATATAGEAALATPSVLTWLVALLATFGHAVMLGALAYRWNVVREQVLAEDGRRQEQRRAARGRGRGRAARSAKTPSGKGAARATPAPATPRRAVAEEASGVSGKESAKGSHKSKAGKGGRKGRGSRRGKRR